jgi:hypothetical protein
VDKGKVGNFALRQSVGGMAKSALFGRTLIFKPLIINVALLGKIFNCISQKADRGPPSPVPWLLYGSLPRPCVSHVERENESVG